MLVPPDAGTSVVLALVVLLAAVGAMLVDAGPDSVGECTGIMSGTRYLLQ